MAAKHKGFKILCSDAVRNRFIECDQSKNSFGSDYHVRESQTQELRMSFPEFAQCAESWTSRRLFFKARTGQHVPPLAIEFTLPLACVYVCGLHICRSLQDALMWRGRPSSASSAGSAGCLASSHLGARMKAELAGVSVIYTYLCRRIPCFYSDVHTEGLQSLSHIVHTSRQAVLTGAG